MFVICLYLHDSYTIITLCNFYIDIESKNSNPLTSYTHPLTSFSFFSNDFIVTPTPIVTGGK